MKNRRQIVEFIQRNNGVNNKTRGIAVGQFLAIAFPNKFEETSVQIFSVLTGKPVVNILFSSEKDGIDGAISVAKWLDEVYKEYLEIPTAKGFEDADVIELCQWTVKNGIQIRIAFDILERAHTQVEYMTPDHVTKAYNMAEPEVKKWLQYVKPR